MIPILLCKVETKSLTPRAYELDLLGLSPLKTPLAVGVSRILTANRVVELQRSAIFLKEVDEELFIYVEVCILGFEKSGLRIRISGWVADEILF